MGFMDNVKKALDGKQDEAADAIDKAADLLDDKTKGKHTDKIDTVADKAKDLADKLDESDEKR